MTTELTDARLANIEAALMAYEKMQASNDEVRRIAANVNAGILAFECAPDLVTEVRRLREQCESMHAKYYRTINALKVGLNNAAVRLNEAEGENHEGN